MGDLQTDRCVFPRGCFKEPKFEPFLGAKIGRRLEQDDSKTAVFFNKTSHGRFQLKSGLDKGLDEAGNVVV